MAHYSKFWMISLSQISFYKILLIKKSYYSKFNKIKFKTKICIECGIPKGRYKKQKANDIKLPERLNQKEINTYQFLTTYKAITFHLLYFCTDNI